MTEQARPAEHICQGCNLPEDGLRVRNVTVRSCGARLCVDCAALPIHLESERRNANDQKHQHGF